MAKEKTGSGQADELRRRAEEIVLQRAGQMPENLKAILPERSRHVLHKIRVHQIEQELQNEKLHESERFVRATLDALSTHIAILDETGSIIAVNRAWRSFAQANHTAVGDVCEGANYFAVCDMARGPDAEQAAAFAAAVRGIIRGEQNEFAMEYPCHSADELRWFNVHVTRFPGEGAVRVVVAHENTTERKRAEEALLQSQTELKTIYEHAPTMMCVLDTSRQVLYANHALAEFVGRPVEELKRELVCDVIGCRRALDDPHSCGHGPHCETCTLQLAMVEALATGRSRKGIEYRTKALYHGELRESVFLASVAPIQISKQSNLLLCLEDITERQRAAEELQESEERYRLLVASSLDAVLLTALDGRILAANDAACRMFGRAEWELIKVGRDGVVDGSDARLAAGLEERDRTGRFHGDLMLIRSDGSKFPGEISSAVFRSQNGDLHSSMVIRDISERRRAGEELRVSREQLRALAAHLQSVREEERTQIAREIHDVLSQDLTRLKIDLVWLQRRLTESSKAAEPGALAARVSEMKRMADAAIQCVQSIATGLRPAVLDSLGLCAAVEWQVRDFQDHTGLLCHATVPQEEIAMDRDAATAAFRILQESLTNVLRHAQASEVDVLLQPEIDQLVLRVRDNGGGIPAEALNSPLSIGLSGMRERALLQGGQLEIRSLPGSGTTIEARLSLWKKENLPEGKP